MFVGLSRITYAFNGMRVAKSISQLSSCKFSFLIEFTNKHINIPLKKRYNNMLKTFMCL